MTDYNGRMETIWRKQVAFFEKETGKVEKEAKKKTKNKKILGFWPTFKKEKAKEESVMTIAWGQADRAYAATRTDDATKKRAALAAYEKAVESAARLAKGFVGRIRMTADKHLPKKEMTAEERKDHERDLQKLFDIIDKQIVAMVSAAETAVYTARIAMKREGESATAAAMRAHRDIENNARKLVTNLKKAAPWLAKVERKPDVATFNDGRKEACRDIYMPVQVTRDLFPKGSHDYKLLDQAAKFLLPYTGDGSPLSADKDTVAEVLRDMNKIKKVLAVLGKWVKNLKEPAV